MAVAAIRQRAGSTHLWGIAVAAVVILAHAPSFFHRLLDGDEAIYGSIAALMNSGGRLYAEGGVDNKPPGIFWVYAATFHFAGTYQMTGVHLVALAAVGATCVVLFLAARAIAGVRAGLLAALLYGVLTGAGNPRLLAANTELFMVLPLSASVLLMLRREWLWSGALLAAAGAFKQVAAVNLLLVPVALLLLETRERRARALGIFAGGLAGGLALGAVLLAVTGSLSGFWRWTVETLYGYAATQWTPDLIWQRAKDSVVPFVGYMIVPWAAAIAQAVRWRRLAPAHQLVVVWLAVSMVGSFAGGHLSWHYFIEAMGPLALLAGLAIDRALRVNQPVLGLPYSTRHWVAGVSLVGLAAPMVGWGVYDIMADPLTYDFGRPVPQHENVAAYIREHTRPGDRVFVWGDWPALYVESDRLMAGRFPGFLRGFTRGSGLPPDNWDTAPDVWPSLQADLANNPPALIIDTSPGNWSDFSMYPIRNYPVLADLVSRHYKAVASFDGVVIYARSVG
jgi:4-amino-4-deoxy-L-arabinose transferase-like glycosyltransferase